MFSLPVKRASQRVGVWRQLKHFGAITLRNSGYLLPNNSVNHERFEWLATSIREFRGEASVIEVQSIDNLSREQLVGRFAAARAGDYQSLIGILKKVMPTMASQPRFAVRRRRLRSRFQEIVAVDFFQSPLRGRVETLLGRMESMNPRTLQEADIPRIRRQDFGGRVWITRPRPGVDRSASAWLIRHAIDTKARFGFASEDGVPHGAVPFDMFHGGFGHRGDDCTFETLAKVFRIRDRKIALIGQIIHDADLGDEKFGRKEGLGIDAVLTGWVRLGISDKKLLARGLQLIEGLYHSLP